MRRRVHRQKLTRKKVCHRVLSSATAIRFMENADHAMHITSDEQRATYWATAVAARDGMTTI